MSFGKHLAAAMVAKGVDQSEMGRRLGVKSQAVNQWISGKTNPAGKRLSEIAAALGISVPELFAWPYEEEGPPTAAERIQWVREAVGVERDEAADLIGVPREEWAAIEAGEKAPSAAQLGKFKARCISAGMPITLDFLMDGDQTGVDRNLIARIGAAHPRFAPLVGIDTDQAGTAPGRDRTSPERSQPEAAENSSSAPPRARKNTARARAR